MAPIKPMKAPIEPIAPLLHQADSSPSIKPKVPIETRAPIRPQGPTEPMAPIELTAPIEPTAPIKPTVPSSPQVTHTPPFPRVPSQTSPWWHHQAMPVCSIFPSKHAPRVVQPSYANTLAHTGTLTYANALAQTDSLRGCPLFGHTTPSSMPDHWPSGFPLWISPFKCAEISFFSVISQHFGCCCNGVKIPRYRQWKDWYHLAPMQFKHHLNVVQELVHSHK